MFHISTRSLGRTIAALTVVSLGLIAAPASATGGGDDPVPCVPKDAWTETVIVTPAVPAVPEVPAVPAVTEERVTNPGQPYIAPTEAVPSQWWNFAPNDHQATFIGAPSFPTDSRGTWIGPHTNGGPDGTGTYPVGNADKGGNWFHRTPGIEGDPGQPYIAPTVETVIVTEAIPAIPGTPAIPAVTEEIEHPAVTCPPGEDEFVDYEVCALWSVDNPEVADFPQTRVDTDDCTVPPATCEGDQRFQQDYYWIRDLADEEYLAGLQHLNSPADDASLEPHNYSMIDVPAKSAEDCATPKTEVTPTAPTGTPDDCDPDPFGTITIPSQDGVVYEVNGVVTPAGTIPANGTNTVTAEAASNDVVLVGTTSWEFTSNPETDCPVPPTDVCADIPGDQSETDECVLIPEEPVLPPKTPEKPTKPSAGPPTTLLTQAPAKPASAAPAPAAEAALPATGAPASLWLVLLGAGLVLGGVALTRRSNV